MLLSEKLEEYSKQGDTNKFKVTYNQLQLKTKVLKIMNNKCIIHDKT